MRLRFSTRGRGGPPRFRLPSREPGRPSRFRVPSLGERRRQRLVFGMTPDELLGGLVKLVAVLLIAGLGGLAIGTALGVGGNEEPVSVSGEPPAAPAPREPEATSTTPADDETRTTTTAPEKPANDVQVRVISAILHPASSPSGRSRKRARVSVHVRVTNRGSRRFAPKRSVLVSAGKRLSTDPAQDTAETQLGSLAPGETADVTLRFETAGEVTQRLRDDLRARLLIAGKTLSATVKVGSPVGGGSRDRGEAG